MILKEGKLTELWKLCIFMFFLFLLYGTANLQWWSPKAVAFSVSLFAQLPSDFRIEGIDTWGRLKHLVAFHR